METADAIGLVEFAILEAVHRGALRSRCTARKIRALREEPAAEAILHRVLRTCERDGLVRGRRYHSGRRYELTAAGRARLRADRRFRSALIGLLARSDLNAYVAAR